MESFALFHIASSFGLESACILTVVDSKFKDTFMTIEEREKSLPNLTLRFEATTEDKLNSIQKEFTDLVNDYLKHHGKTKEENTQSGRDWFPLKVWRRCLMRGERFPSSRLAGIGPCTYILSRGEESFLFI